MKYEWLDEYLLEKPGTEKDFKLEWGWHHDLVNLKCDPRLAEAFREQYPEVLPGFYCDKRLWIAALLDGDLPDLVLRELCDMSYELVVSKLPKYVQRELAGGG